VTAREKRAPRSGSRAPAAPLEGAPAKKPSGSEFRKRRAAKDRRERELRLELLRVQGREVEERRVEWRPWPHARPVFEAFDAGVRWQAHVWHRRASKTSTCLALIAKAAKERVGTYWHMLPKLVQARTVVWDSRRADGLREIDVHFPPELRSKVSDDTMQIELVNGSAVRFLGSDNFDRLVGANVHGIVFDEFARADPAAWDYLAPILVADPEKLAWAVFISTYRGRNHWYRMYQRVKDDPEWFTSNLTIEDTERDDGSPIVTAAEIERERAQGKAEEYLRQEYYNDPLAALEGAYYGAVMRAMQTSGRVGPVLYDPMLPVVASVDLGFADELVFTFWQSVSNEERCIGSRSWKFATLTDALDDVRGSFPWGKRPMLAVLPHDGRFGAGELFEHYGYDTAILARSQNVPAEIEKVRGFLGRTRIDNAVRPWTENEENNARLLEALLGYRTERSKTDAETHQKTASHTWEAHWADSVRYYVVYRDEFQSLSGWGSPPNYAEQDRAVV
jgi:hypothetical protein